MSLMSLLSLTEQMLCAALEKQWELLETLQPEHADLARDLFQSDEEITQDKLEIVSKIIALTSQVTSLAEVSKMETAGDLKLIRKGHAGQAAYLHNID